MRGRKTSHSWWFFLWDDKINRERNGEETEISSSFFSQLCHNFIATQEKSQTMQVCADLARCLSTGKSWTPSAFEPRQLSPSSRANSSARTLNSVWIVPPHVDRNLAIKIKDILLRLNSLNFFFCEIIINLKRYCEGNN